MAGDPSIDALQESGWEELRREARKIEGDLDVKLSSYAKLGARFNQRGFICPFVPLLPIACILINVYLLVNLGPNIKIPASVVMPIARIVELIYKLLAPYGMKVPQMTPSRIRLLSLSRTFDCSKANDLLGYTPIVPLQEGLRRTIESYTHLRADVQTKKDGPSKAEVLLSRGKA